MTVVATLRRGNDHEFGICEDSRKRLVISRARLKVMPSIEQVKIIKPRFEGKGLYMNVFEVCPALKL